MDKNTNAPPPSASSKSEDTVPVAQHDKPTWRLIVDKVRSPLVILIVAVLAFWLGGELMGGSGTAGQGGSQTSAKGNKGGLWTCSMHPQIKLPNPGKCPICGMDLIPLDSGGGKQRGHGPGTVQLTKEAVKQAKIRTVLVTSTKTSADMEALGRLEVDETSIRTVTPWTSGRLDRLVVRSTGEKVKRGQAIGSLYSPEVLTAQQEYLIAQRQLKAMNGAIPVAVDGAKAALESAKQRLMLLGFNGGELRRLSSRGKPSRNVAVISSYSGTVLELLVHEGAYVQTGTPLLKLANLDKLWVQLDVYENDLPRVAKGQTVKLAMQGLPDETFVGHVTFIDPVLDPNLRTARVRVEVENKDGRLRPGMFARAIIEASGVSLSAKTGQASKSGKHAGMKMTKGKVGKYERSATKGGAGHDDTTLPASRAVPLIPASAVLFTGKRSVVYVEKPGTEQPTYELRVVTLGARNGDNYPVLSGVKIGERVVAQGAFAIDADLQIRGGESMMSRNDDIAREALSPVDLPDADMQRLAPVLSAYLDFTEALANDDLQVAKTALEVLGGVAGNAQLKSVGKGRDVWRQLRDQMLPAAWQGSRATSLTEARNILLALSRTMVPLVQRIGNPAGEPVRLAFCPMADNSRGALWLQRGEKIRNPYFGKKMLTCGSIRQVLTQGDRATEHAVRGKKSASKPAPKKAGHQH